MEPDSLSPDPEHSKAQLFGHLTAPLRPQHHQRGGVAIGESAGLVNDGDRHERMRHGLLRAWVDEVAATFFLVPVGAAGSHALVRQRDGLQCLALGGFGGLDADSPRLAVRRFSDGGDLAADFEEEVAQASCLQQRDEFIDHETFGDAGDVDS